MKHPSNPLNDDASRIRALKGGAERDPSLDIGVEEVGKSNGNQEGELKEKVAEAIDLLRKKCRQEDLDPFIEVKNELIELAKVAKSGSLRLDDKDEFEDWTNFPELEEDELPFEEGSGMKSSKKQKISIVGQYELGKLGICQKDMQKSSPDCGESKKQGKIPNQEKFKWDGEESG